MSWLKKMQDEEEELGRMVQHAAELHGVSNKDVVDVLLDEEEEYEGRSRHRPGVWITLVMVGVVFGVAVVAILKFVNGPVVAGPSVQSQIEDSKQSAQPSPDMPSLEGLKVSFSYPNALSDVSRVRNAAGIEQYLLRTKGDGASVQIAVSVDSLPSGNLADDSSYQFRTLKSAGYTRSDIKMFGEPAVLLTKQDNTERTIFWPHKGMELTISGTTTGDFSNLTSYMATISNSLRWQG